MTESHKPHHDLANVFDIMRAAGVPFYRPGGGVSAAKLDIAESLEIWLAKHAPGITLAVTKAKPHTDGSPMVQVTLTNGRGQSESRSFKVHWVPE